MKNLRIVFLLVFSVLTGARLSAAEIVVLENKQPVLTPKTAQADTVRMTWTDKYGASESFFFFGEKGATYEVDWGDGETQTVMGEGAETEVWCSHRYVKKGTYTVLLYGVSK